MNLFHYAIPRCKWFGPTAEAVLIIAFAACLLRFAASLTSFWGSQKRGAHNWRFSVCGQVSFARCGLLVELNVIADYTSFLVDEDGVCAGLIGIPTVSALEKLLLTEETIPL